MKQKYIVDLGGPANFTYFDLQKEHVFLNNNNLRV